MLFETANIFVGKGIFCYLCAIFYVLSTRQKMKKPSRTGNGFYTITTCLLILLVNVLPAVDTEVGASNETRMFRC